MTLAEARLADGVLRVTAPVLLVKPIAAGDGVSYGHIWHAPEDGWTALVAMGYGDGIPRSAGNRERIRVGSREHPIAGRVAMNALVLWLGADDAGVRVGDLAEYRGSAPAAMAAGETYAEVDLGAYRRNLRMLRDRIAPAELIAVVKDDAYGHGLGRVVPAALDEGVTAFAVQDLETAAAVRPLAPDARLIAWLWTAEQLPELHRIGAEIGVHSAGELATAVAGYPGAPLHLKLDSGLHRGGVPLADWPAVLERAAALDASGAIRVVGAFTHLAEAGDAEDSAQLSAFRTAALELEERLGRPVLKHAAASAAGYARPDARFDAVRFGAFGYGIAPGAGVGPGALGLEPVMRYVVDGSVVFGSQLRGEPTLQEFADAQGTIGEEIVVQLPRAVERRYVG